MSAQTSNLPNSTVVLSDFNVREKDTGSSSTVFIEPFEIGINDQYLMVFTSGNCRIFSVNNATGDYSFRTGFKDRPKSTTRIVLL